MTHTYVIGAAVGLNDKTLPGLLFDIEAAYTGCLICGEVYQGRLDRRVHLIHQTPTHPLSFLLKSYEHTADGLRKDWARKHARTHTVQEHISLKKSGLFCTPEAALKLTPLGIFPVDEAALTDEISCAMLEAPRAPANDVQT